MKLFKIALYQQYLKFNKFKSKFSKKFIKMCNLVTLYYNFDLKFYFKLYLNLIIIDPNLIQ